MTENDNDMSVDNPVYEDFDPSKPISDDEEEDEIQFLQQIKANTYASVEQRSKSTVFKSKPFGPHIGTDTSPTKKMQPQHQRMQSSQGGVFGALNVPAFIEEDEEDDIAIQNANIIDDDSENSSDF